MDFHFVISVGVAVLVDTFENVKTLMLVEKKNLALEHSDGMSETLACWYMYQTDWCALKLFMAYQP